MAMLVQAAGQRPATSSGLVGQLAPSTLPKEARAHHTIHPPFLGDFGTGEFSLGWLDAAAFKSGPWSDE
jgi:hypothetical protein